MLLWVLLLSPGSADGCFFTAKGGLPISEISCLPLKKAESPRSYFFTSSSWIECFCSKSSSTWLLDDSSEFFLEIGIWCSAPSGLSGLSIFSSSTRESYFLTCFEALSLTRLLYICYSWFPWLTMVSRLATTGKSEQTFLFSSSTVILNSSLG